MALITPPELLETQSYPFQRLRYMSEHLGLQEGVWGATDYKVVQRAAGANPSVDVGAGAAFIKGDTGTRQGLYHQVNDATMNLVVGAAHATNPRIDQVILRIFDSTVSGGSDTPTLSVLAGTATGGATLDNRTGAAALPNDAIRLADILVPATDTTITDNQIRDRRPWARGARWSVVMSTNAGAGADYSTAAGYAGIVDAVNLSARLELSGAPVEAFLSCSIQASAAGQHSVGLFVGGTERGRREWSPPVNNQWFPFHAAWTPTLAAGSYVFDPVFGAAAGTLKLSADGAGNRHLHFLVREMPTQNARNS